MFYIINQGARIKTPVEDLLRTKDVPVVSASSATKAIKSSPDQVPQPAVRGAAQSVTHRSVTDKETAYQQAEHADEPERSRVIYAQQIMTSPVTTASIDNTLSDIWSLFAREGFHHLPIVDEQRQIQGIVSDRDLLRFAANNNREVGNYRIGQLMTRKVISAAEQTEVRVIAEVMCGHAIGALPIVNDQGELQGIVSRSDILRTLVHRAPLELWA